MTAKERIQRALRGEPVDRVPVASLMTGVTVELMQLSGYAWPNAHKEADAMVELAAASHRFAGIETMKLPFDMLVETEVLGGEVSFGDETTMPQALGHLYAWPDMPQIPGDILRRGRIPMVLDAIRLAKARYDGEIAVVSSIVGPFTLAGKLYGMEDLLVGTLTEPDETAEILDVLTDLCILYARAQADAGADVVQIGEASCSGDLISPDTYGTFIAPMHRRLCAAVPVPTVVHICGNIEGHLPFIAETGMTALSFDVKTDPEKARELLAGKVRRVGWIDPLAVLARGTEQQVYDAAKACLAGGTDVLNAGCAWAPETPLANVRAMVRAGE